MVIPRRVAACAGSQATGQTSAPSDSKSRRSHGAAGEAAAVEAPEEAVEVLPALPLESWPQLLRPLVPQRSAPSRP